MPARVLELAYRGALKALAPLGHVGSNPTPGIALQTWNPVTGCEICQLAVISRGYRDQKLPTRETVNPRF
jgi:hypothetical protein